MNADWLWPFLLLAGGLAAAFSASLVWAGSDARAPRMQSATLAVLAPLALIALYALLGHPRALNPAESAPALADQAEAMVQRLSERLARQPDDPDGWLMLARSRKVLGRYAEAAQAYEQVADRASQDPELLADWIEARILASDQHFDLRSRQLLAKAMQMAPEHPGVLLMRGLAALDRGDRTAARQAFTLLREQHPEGSPDRAALDDALARLARGEDPRVGASKATP